MTASHYGIPQARTRVFFVGIKGDAVVHVPPPVSLKITPRDLLEDLEDVPEGFWKVAVFHRDLVRVREDPGTGKAYYSFDKFGNYVLPILLKHDVDVAFQGHAHRYTAVDWKCTPDVSFCNPAIQGKMIRLVTTGGGGNSLRHDPPTNVDDIGLDGYIYDEKSSHVTIGTLDGNQMHLKAIRADGSIMHERTIDKNEKNG